MAARLGEFQFGPIPILKLLTIRFIQSELGKGRIRELTSLPESYYCPPIGLIPKKLDGEETGWRMIFDLSWPTGLSVNDNVPVEYGEIANDVASRFDFKKLADLGFQDQIHNLRRPPSFQTMTTLRRKLRSFYITL